jgi:hypothetical protein
VHTPDVGTRKARPLKAGVSAPEWLWAAVEVERKRARPDLPSRSAAVAEAMAEWVARQRQKEAA